MPTNPKPVASVVPATGAKTRLPDLVREALSLLPAVPVLAIGATLLPTHSAVAAVIAWNSNLTIPNTDGGLYINVETRDNGPTSDIPGWNLNPYGSSATAMSWYANNAAPSACVIGLGQGGTTLGVASLSFGTFVSAASTFDNTDSSTDFGGWMLNADNYFGFRFVAADTLTHYGYGVMTVGANMGIRTLASVSYEDAAGVGITVVPEAGTWIAALFAAGAVGLEAFRRRRAA